MSIEISRETKGRLTDESRRQGPPPERRSTGHGRRARQHVRRPELIANLMPVLDGRRGLQRCAVRGMTFQPRMFKLALAADIGVVAI